MSELVAAGIETFTLDVLDDNSIKACVEQISSLVGERGLDILINNAGGGYNMPISDIDINKGRELFDLNVWSYITVTQAFLPLLIKSGKTSQTRTMVINNTSISSLDLTPFNSVYQASKAAVASFSAHMRLEFHPFGISVVDLKTGSVRSRFHANRSDPRMLPEGSLYTPIKKEAEQTMNGELYIPTAMPVEEWAKDVVGDLLREGKPPAEVWRGRYAGETWWKYWFGPTVDWWDGGLRERTGLEKLGRLLRGQ